VFVEVRTRTAREDQTALPELSVTAEKQHLVGRTARRFLMERHLKECPLRFDVVAIEEFLASRSAAQECLQSADVIIPEGKSTEGERNALI
jgi:Holliday junction resolvase-like predicted endonuclease